MCFVIPVKTGIHDETIAVVLSFMDEIFVLGQEKSILDKSLILQYHNIVDYALSGRNTYVSWHHNSFGKT